MPVFIDRGYEEAAGLWRALTDRPLPPGDARELLAAAIDLAQVADYERLSSRWLKSPAFEWAVYEDAPPGLA